jgi:DNA-binding response OmpR family regulator
MAIHGQFDVASAGARSGTHASRPSRVVVIESDTRLHASFTRALRKPEFEAHCFADPHVGLVRLSEIGPDVIVCAAGIRGLIGKSIHRAARSSPQLERVPFLFLTADAAARRELEPVLAGADACLSKPFTAEALLEKIRHAASASPGVPRAAEADPALAPSLSGQTDRKGLFALMRLMEDARLTGRFVLETEQHRLYVDWLAGTPVDFGASPETLDGDPLGLLLSTEGGRYGFEARGVQSSTRRSQRRGSAAHSSARSPIGRFANVELNGRRIQVFTEGVHTPNFTIVTVVAAAGVGVRKVESSWKHPLKRASDYALANQEVNRQHESVLAMVKDGVVTPQPLRKVWDVVGGGVEGDLLIWVLGLLRSLVAERLGTLPALALLRRELARSSERQLALREFHVEDDGTISLEAADEAVKRKTLSGWRLPRGAVEGVAIWAASFHAEAGQLVGSPRLPSLRDCTRMRKAELDAIGFYEALP